MSTFNLVKLTQIDAVLFLSGVVHTTKDCETASKSVKSHPSELLW